MAPGSLVSIYGTELAAGLAQADSDALRTATTKPTVLIGGTPAQLLFAGMSPQFVGVNQINVLIPSGTPTCNAVSLRISLGGVTTSDAITIAVSQ